MWWRRQVVSGRPSPTDGEAVAVLHGVQEAKARGWAVLDLCFESRSSFHALSFSFIRRSGVLPTR